MSHKPRRTALTGALLTVASLIGGLVAGLAAGTLVFETLPGHSIDNPTPIHIAIAATPMLAGLLAGGALWAVWMGRLAGRGERGRLARAGMLGFAPITLVLAILLSALEPLAVSLTVARFPIHRLFTLLFTPSAFLIASISVSALSRALGDGVWGPGFSWQVGLAAAGAFLAINLLMESMGWVVGGPNAAARLTMLTVLFAGNTGAALAGGALLGWRLGQARG